MESIFTNSLELMPFTYERMLDAAASREQLGTSLQLKIAAEWPDPDLTEALPYFAECVRQEPALAQWNRLFVHRADRVVIGAAGFKALPDRHGSVEIGYGVAPPYRRMGFATEAVVAMCAWAFRQPHVTIVRAECLPHNPASAGVVRRAGFVERRSNDSMRRWVLARENH